MEKLKHNMAFEAMNTISKHENIVTTSGCIGALIGAAAFALGGESSLVGAAFGYITAFPAFFIGSHPQLPWTRTVKEARADIEKAIGNGDVEIHSAAPDKERGFKKRRWFMVFPREKYNLDYNTVIPIQPETLFWPKKRLERLEKMSSQARL